jgi:hypothetical protein
VVDFEWIGKDLNNYVVNDSGKMGAKIKHIS